MSNFDNLVKEILFLSENKNFFNSSKKEWYVYNLVESNEPESCLCGKFPIKNLCYIKNNLNNNIALVGNCCVKHFDLNYDWFFNGVKRLKANLRPTGQFIIYLHDKKIINEWEYIFLTDRENSKKKSIKQDLKEKQIINKILKQLEKNRSCLY